MPADRRPRERQKYSLLNGTANTIWRSTAVACVSGEFQHFMISGSSLLFPALLYIYIYIYTRIYRFCESRRESRSGSGFPFNATLV
jgi:hypothetical protein